MSQVQDTAPGLPASYRIGLAVSGAVLFHTLLLSGLSSPLQAPEELTHRVSVELVSPGSATQSRSVHGTTIESDSNPTPALSADRRNPRFEIEPTLATTGESSRRTPEPAPDQTQPLPRTTETSSANATSSNRAAASPPASAGKQVVVTAPRPVATETRITQSPDEQDPYLIKLAVHLGYELEKLREPMIARLTKRVTMEIELSLLSNGALTRARIVKSTGVKAIDEAAYRASLAASPYPEPPANGKSRFEVELVFSPNRL